MLFVAFALASVHREAPNAVEDDQPPPPPRPADASAVGARPPRPRHERPAHTMAHTHMDPFHGTAGRCPTSLTGLDDICEQQCETDDQCGTDELCCHVGCSSACALAILPGRFSSKALGIVSAMIFSWILVFMMLNGTTSGTTGGSSD